MRIIVAILFASLALPRLAYGLTIRDIGDLFAQACISSVAEPAAVKSWVLANHLSAITNPNGLREFAGSTGVAWQLITSDNVYVIAVRQPNSGCAVFAERADPSVSARQFNAITAALPKELGTAKVLATKTAQGQQGLRTMRVAAGMDDSDKVIKSMMMIITEERFGGPYQATMQISNLHPPGGS